MTILYLCHRIPYPPDKGEKIRAFQQIEWLSREHRIHLVCFVDDARDLGHAASLRKYCETVEVVYRSRGTAQLLALAALPTRESLTVRAFRSSELQRRIVSLCRAQHPDLILAFSSAMAQYAVSQKGIPTVLDFVDVDSDKWRLYSEHTRWPLSWVYKVEAGRLRRYEQAMARRSRRCIFVSQAEANLLPDGTSGIRSAIVGAGVDLVYYDPAAAPPASAAAPAIVFVGLMNYFPNVDAVTHFCERVYPRILERRPDAEFHIVGRNPTRAVRRLGQRPGVMVTGTVDDVRPYLARAAVVTTPFRIARGVQNKVLEAMAMARPVVGTPVAFQGLRATRSDGIRIAERPDDLADEILALLEDRAQRDELGLAARRYVERNHRWEDHAQALDKILREVLAES